MSGLKMEPGQSYALADRFTCAQCGETPRIMNAKNDSGSLTITLSCHGDTATWQGSKSDLSSVEFVFESEHE